ncbi:cell division protein FtsQ/DivIB [Patiriisocius hiemis]|uniref:Cell division protein FtsQ/DivIB n=1 Tax=Patiriisocius hiemis TaxID=3075604 RepID=A0ABU2YC49_9FLAO|nr:cell division protein FtsQ/DivIB [Constantimarinum sp. W242]MDT0555753.1 cell division protein FtsQ/DivIB [Constantimarinum sp. W242]
MGKWNYIKIVLLLGLLVFLFGFANKRNQARNLTKIDIKFQGETPPFITLEAVNKLLIQNQGSVTNVNKETLVLKEMESRLLKNPMIRDADVFITVDGVLGAKIEQRKPIARVASSTDFYLDFDGKKMPLSNVYSARVPLITGSSNTDFEALMPLLLKVNDDSFMKSIVVGLEVFKNGTVHLRLRKNDLKVEFGNTKAIDKKFQNFKAFYKKMKEDKKLSLYKKVNLTYGNQVVATKK